MSESLHGNPSSSAISLASPCLKSRLAPQSYRGWGRSGGGRRLLTSASNAVRQLFTYSWSKKKNLRIWTSHLFRVRMKTSHSSSDCVGASSAYNKKESCPRCLLKHGAESQNASMSRIYSEPSTNHAKGHAPNEYRCIDYAGAPRSPARVNRLGAERGAVVLFSNKIRMKTRGTTRAWPPFSQRRDPCLEPCGTLHVYILLVLFFQA